jgi:hypothetical protein
MLVHIAHSQGALITSLCGRHLSVAQRARIHVIVLGGAASLSDREYGSAVNYYCSNEVRRLAHVHTVVNAAHTQSQEHGSP